MACLGVWLFGYFFFLQVKGETYKLRPNFGVVLCIPPGVSALGHKDKCSVITHQVKQGNCWPKKHSLVQTLYIPKWTFAPAPHPRGLKRDFLRFSESRFQTNSVSTAREDRERPLFRISSFVMNHLFSGRRLLIVTSWLAGALA